MDTVFPLSLADRANATMDESNRRIAATLAGESARLARFIARRVSEPGDAEDILQDVLFAFVEQYRLPQPIEQVGAWLIRVARHRIIDRFRKKREQPLRPALATTDDDDGGDGDYWLAHALPAADGDPERQYFRTRLLAAMAQALDELPVHQREVFIAHELDGVSFKEMASARGVGVNTLLGWKRQAVLHLRTRLQPFYDELS